MDLSAISFNSLKKLQNFLVNRIDQGEVIKLNKYIGSSYVAMHTYFKVLGENNRNRSQSVYLFNTAIYCEQMGFYYYYWYISWGRYEEEIGHTYVFVVMNSGVRGIC